MGEWKKVSLKDIGDVCPSNVDKKISASEIPVKLCNYMNAYTSRRINNGLPFSMGSVSPTEYKKFKLQRNDVLITKDSETPNDIGVPTVVTEDIDNLVCGYHLALIRPNSKEYNGEYLMYALQTEGATSYFTKMCNGLTRYGLTISAIEKQTLSVPIEIKEQKKIAEILTTVDITIEKTGLIIDKYKNIKAGLMQDLLANGIDEQGNVRSPKTHEYKDSPLGRIPMEWECAPLKNYCNKISSGGTPSRKDNELWDGSIPWLTTTEIDFSRIENSIQTISEKGLCSSSAKLFPVGTILIAMYGEGQTRGKAAILGVEAATNQACAALCVNEKNNVSYLFFYLSSQYNRLRESSNDGSQKNLSLQILNNFYIIAPKSVKEQELISERINSVDQKIQSERDYLNKILNIKLGLMQDLLTHKVPVDALL